MPKKLCSNKMSKSKTFSIKVNDILDELKDENNRLYKQLLIADKCNQLLNKFRDNLIDFNNCCKCETNIEIKVISNHLLNEYKCVYNELNSVCLKTTDKSSDKTTNDLLKVCKNKSISQIKVNTDSDEDRQRISDTEDEDYSEGVVESESQNLNERKTTDRWTKNETQVIIKVWNEFKDRLIGMGPKKVVWSDIQSRLLESRIWKSTEQIRNKIKNLTAETEVQNPSDSEPNEDIERGIDDTIQIAKTYVCEWSECGVVFNTFQALTAHVRKGHTKEKPFVCDKCDQTFAMDYYLRKHMNRTHGLPVEKMERNSGSNETIAETTDDLRKTHVCDWSGCGLAFHKNESLLAHIRKEHTMERPFKCNKCDKAFTIEYYLRKHLIRVHRIGKSRFVSKRSRGNSSGMRQMCPFVGCGKDFRRPSDLKIHVMSVHTNERPFECDKCGKSFAAQYYLRKHIMRTHYVDDSAPGYESGNDERIDSEQLRRDLQCDWSGCELRFNRFYELAAHYKSEHKNSSPFKCTDCEIRFKHHFQLMKHKSIKHKTTSIRAANMRYKTFVCDWPDCGLVFEYNLQLTAHIRRVHTLEKPYECDLCGTQFAMKEYLRKHKFRTHKTLFWCDMCQYQCTDRQQLTEHYKSNPEHKKYKCSECPMSFRKSSQLVEHINGRHTAEKRFKCTETNCEKVFKTAHQLWKHKYCHTNVRPHQCEWPGCGKAFLTNSYLKIHRKTHLDDREFVCDYDNCVKAFKYKVALDLHKQTHLTVKQYACSWPACDESFSVKSGLDSHMNKHQGIRPFKCLSDGCQSPGFYRRVDLKKHYRCIHKLTPNEVKEALNENKIVEEN